jgi:glucokinase
LNRAVSRKKKDIALIAPGTGLGEALLIFRNENYVAVSSEGGHADFAPSSDAEIGLWKYLHKRFGHVSVERVISGSGLFNIYSWLKDSGEYEEPSWLAQRVREDDPAKVITQAATDKQDPLCVESLDMFVSILGATAGNLALTGMTTGGVYLGGGIPPKILPFLKKGLFMKSFHAKGRFTAMLEKIPVKVILNDSAALLGAAKYAFDTLM